MKTNTRPRSSMSAGRAWSTAFRLRARMELQYRAAAAGGFFTQLFFGLILIFLYQALDTAGIRTGQSTIEFADTVAYVWIQQAFFRLLFGSDGSLNQAILSGDLVYELCRPVRLYPYWTVRILAYKITSSLMRAWPLLVLASFLPEPWRLHWPDNIRQLAAFILSLLLGMLTISFLDALMSGITMRTLDPRGITNIISMFSLFFSGNLLPLTLFPDAWQGWLQALPFAQSLDAPIRLFTGQTALSDFPAMLLRQAIWIVLLAGGGSLLWHHNLKRLVIQGG
ncbi:MAG: hypothetical protein VB070_14900 [Clostridiaceae bacterium]|nr:hypothetical protein [Clostridiaceae bacterium]